MLSPHNRQLYSSLFVAPADYAFDCAVGTTFSLDLESLLFVPYCIASQGGQPENAGPIAVLEAIQRTSERVTVFCQDGETSAPEPPSAVYGLLEDCIVPTRVRIDGALFHPKLWVIRFTSETEKSPLLRVAVLSRNLTRSRAWDTIVCLHGFPQAKRTVSDSAGLRDLVAALPTFVSSGSLDERRLQQVNLLADEAGRTQFESPQPFTGVAFVASGLREKSGFAPKHDDVKRMLAISPFVSSRTLEELAKLTTIGERLLVGRPEEMGKCSQEALSAWRCKALDDGTNPVNQGDDPERDLQTADAAPEGLHAKALVLDTGKETVWYLGSANLTDPVRNGSHVELMVRLVGPSKLVGIDAFLGDEKTGFQALLREYFHSTLPPDPQDGARSLVDKSKQALVDAQLHVRCLAADATWTLELSGQVGLPGGVSVRCRPVSLPTAHCAQFRDGMSRFNGLSIEALTGLFFFEVSAGSGDGQYEQSFTRKLPVAGLPAERDAHIARSIVKDRSAFLHYLRCLLSEAGEPGLGVLAGREVSRRGAEGSVSLFASGLLEDLVKTLHRYPKRLENIKNLVASSQLQLTSKPDEESVMPPEFLEVWNVFAAHLTETSL